MKTLLFCACCLAACLWTTKTNGQNTGHISFSGTVQLDSTSVATATNVYLNTATNTVSTTSGVFSGVPLGTRLSFTTNTWPINSSGPITNFWSVGGYTFNLNSSTGTVVNFFGSSFLSVTISGTVSSNGIYLATYVGSFSTQNPPSDGINTFTESFSFSAITPPNLVAKTRVSGNWIIAWPTNSLFNYTLQQNTNLLSTNWTTSAYPITNGFGTNFCTVPLTNGNIFFRLSL